MFLGKKILGIIPARGGSKGVPRKNVRVVGGKPLIAWTIDEAKKSKYLDRIILSSDDDEIIDVARQYKCDVPFKRPSELASDDSPAIATVVHAISNMKESFDYLVLLQPTSPMRTVEDIDGCIEKCLNMKSLSCVSVSVVDKSPYWMFSVDDASRMTPILESATLYQRRQDLPLAYTLNGAVYVAECHWLEAKGEFVDDKTLAYEMPKNRSVDIDTKSDLKYLEFLLKCRKPM